MCTASLFTPNPLHLLCFMVKLSFLYENKIKPINMRLFKFVIKVIYQIVNVPLFPSSVKASHFFSHCKFCF